MTRADIRRCLRDGRDSKGAARDDSVRGQAADRPCQERHRQSRPSARAQFRPSPRCTGRDDRDGRIGDGLKRR
jgi:hypothetical protein